MTNVSNYREAGAPGAPGATGAAPEPAGRQLLGWMAVTFILFPVLIVLGMFLRTIQSNALAELQDWFYPIMTLHGLGMVGLWYVSSMACVSHVLSRYVAPSAVVSRVALVGTVLGVAMLLACVLLGKFAAGWYFLYPLPFRGSWPRWSTIMFLAALTTLGATWLVWSLDLLRAIAARYSLRHALAWHYIAGRSAPETPPAVLIATVSLVACIACLVSAVAALALYYNELFTGARNDALLVKNLTFFFGHTLVNLSMYLGVAVVYDVLPRHCDRPWKTNRVVAISWNAVLVIVLVAYFHHLYMDFVQPGIFQYLGQIASYASSIPASVVTLFGALALVYRSKMRWNITSSLFFLGLMGWAIGGVGAVIDSTIAVNARFHNTLWVPAHFHTYMVSGLVLLVLGYFYHHVQEQTKRPERKGTQTAVAALFSVGGYGFLLTFFVSGAASVPRRFAIYPAELSVGATYARLALVFIALFLTGLGVYLWETGRRWLEAIRAGSP